MPNFKANTSSLNIFIDSFILFVIVSALLCFVLLSSFVIYDPTAAIFLGSLIPQKYFTLPVQIFIIFFHIYILCVIALNIAVDAGCVLAVQFYITFILTRELCMDRRGSYKSCEKLRTLEYILVVYRSLQILQIYGLCYLGWFLLLCNSVFMLSSLYSIFVLMRYWFELSNLSKGPLLSFSVAIIVIWGTCLEMGRYMFVGGSKVLRSWRGKKWGDEKENKIMKKFQRSCKPIFLCYGTWFVIRRVSLIIFLKGVVRGTFRALLASK